MCSLSSPLTRRALPQGRDRVCQWAAAPAAVRGVAGPRGAPGARGAAAVLGAPGTRLPHLHKRPANPRGGILTRPGGEVGAAATLAVVAARGGGWGARHQCRQKQDQELRSARVQAPCGRWACHCSRGDCCFPLVYDLGWIASLTKKKPSSSTEQDLLPSHNPLFRLKSSLSLPRRKGCAHPAHHPPDMTSPDMTSHSISGLLMGGPNGVRVVAAQEPRSHQEPTFPQNRWGKNPTLVQSTPTQ